MSKNYLTFTEFNGNEGEEWTYFFEITNPDYVEEWMSALTCFEVVDIDDYGIYGAEIVDEKYVKKKMKSPKSRSNSYADRYQMKGELKQIHESLRNQDNMDEDQIVDAFIEVYYKGNFK